MSNSSKRFSRRTFLAVGGVAAAGAAGYGLFSKPKPNMAPSIGAIPPNPDAVHFESPEALRDFEALGIRHFSELDKLPWFEKDESGQFRLRAEAGIERIIDTHSHLGWAFGLGHSIDMTKQCAVEYFYDYDKEQDLLFEQIHPTPQEAAGMSREDLTLFLRTPQRNRTQTVANLALEMDAMKYTGIVSLPIAIPHQIRHANDTLAAAKLDKRLVPFGAVYPKPWGQDKIAELERQIAEHAIKGVKYHPVFQLMAPDSPEMMKMFEWCEAHDLLIYAHTGYTGREPKFMRAKSEPELFEKPLAAFPKLRMVLAHTGVRRIDQALAVARKFEERVWLDISGQTAPAITYILQRFNTDKIMFASDWPFYPLSVMVARGLVATAPCPQLREKFFYRNAEKLLGWA